jgi:hypothetical protein
MTLPLLPGKEKRARGVSNFGKTLLNDSSGQIIKGEPKPTDSRRRGELKKCLAHFNRVLEKHSRSKLFGLQDHVRWRSVTAGIKANFKSSLRTESRCAENGLKLPGEAVFSGQQAVGS